MYWLLRKKRSNLMKIRVVFFILLHIVGISQVLDTIRLKTEGFRTLNVGNSKVCYYEECKYLYDDFLRVYNDLVVRFSFFSKKENDNILKSLGYSHGVALYLFCAEYSDRNDKCFIDKVLLDTFLVYNFDVFSVVPPEFFVFRRENKLYLFGLDILEYDLASKKIRHLFDFSQKNNLWTRTGIGFTHWQLCYDDTLFFYVYPIKFKRLYKNKKLYNSYKPFVKVKIDSLFINSNYKYFGRIVGYKKRPYYLNTYYGIWVDSINNKIYIKPFRSDYINVHNASGKLLESIYVGKEVIGFWIHTGKLYVLYKDYNINIFDICTNELIKSILFPYKKLQFIGFDKNNLFFVDSEYRSRSLSYYGYLNIYKYSIE